MRAQTEKGSRAFILYLQEARIKGKLTERGCQYYTEVERN